MSGPIEFLPPISAIHMPAPMDAVGVQAAQGSPAVASNFATLVGQGLQSVNADWMQAQEGIKDLAAGGTANLHDVMMRLEESRISFQLFLQVRNRLVESYQDLMRMQI